MRGFKTVDGMKKAIKREGLNLMNFEAVDTEIGFVPRFFVHDEDDQFEIERRGFFAEISPRRAAS